MIDCCITPTFCSGCCLVPNPICSESVSSDCTLILSIVDRCHSASDLPGTSCEAMKNVLRPASSARKLYVCMQVHGTTLTNQAQLDSLNP